MSDTTDALLTKLTYEVLKRVPSDWWAEQDAKREIADALGLTFSDVARRMQSLIRMRLVERRKRNTIEPVTEIRRVGK